MGRAPESTLTIEDAEVSVWLGSLDSSRELVRERTIVQRGSAVGVRLPAYLLSKLGVPSALSIFQTLVLTGVVLAFRPFEVSGSDYLALLAILALTGLLAVSMGMLISSSSVHTGLARPPGGWARRCR